MWNQWNIMFPEIDRAISTLDGSVWYGNGPQNGAIRNDPIQSVNRDVSTANHREDFVSRTVTSLVYRPVGSGADANARWGHSSVAGRRPREKSQITGCGLPPHHRNLGYVAKRAKICIHREGGGAGESSAGGAFLWRTWRFNGPRSERLNLAWSRVEDIMRRLYYRA